MGWVPTSFQVLKRYLHEKGAAIFAPSNYVRLENDNKKMIADNKRAQVLKLEFLFQRWAARKIAYFIFFSASSQ